MTDLQNHVQSIAENLTNGFKGELNHDGEPFGAYDYLQDSLDIRYIVSGKGEYIAAKILVAFGGPNIWVNLESNQVEGYWGGERAIAYFEDNLGLDDALSELWACR